jgi:hypothetical protein
MRGRRSLLILATLAGLAAAPAGAAAQSNTAATQAYVRADLALAQTAAAHLSVAEAGIQGVLHRARSSCPFAAANSPQDPESTELSNEVIGAIVTAAIHSDLASIRGFVAATTGLRWSNRTLSAAVASYVSRLKGMAALPEPPLCSDVAGWAAAGFHAVPARARSFQQRFMNDWVAIGELPMGMLSRYASGEVRALASRAEQLEGRIVDFEARAVEKYTLVMNALDLYP